MIVIIMTTMTLVNTIDLREMAVSIIDETREREFFSTEIWGRRRPLTDVRNRIQILSQLDFEVPSDHDSICAAVRKETEE